MHSYTRAGFCDACRQHNRLLKYAYGSNGEGRVGGTGMSVQDMAQHFPTYDTAALPSEGSWYTGPWETDAMSRVRCERVARWLRSPDLRSEVRGGKRSAPK
eukprot:m.801045 g.801045  ORF g.801045 m.801045 type:complete len:101 (-) comp23357_c0_seq56:948-1250(-)